MSSNLRNLDAMLRAMVFCRGVASFLGYPVQVDPAFTSLELLLSFSGVIDSCAQSRALWDFNSFDVAAVFSPLLDYAEMISEAQKDIKSFARNQLNDLKIRDIELMQENLTFLGASVVAEEIDTLTRTYSDEDSWIKWFGFIRYTKSIQMQGLPEWCLGFHANDVAWTPAIRTYGITARMMHVMEEQMASQKFFVSCCNLQKYTLGRKAFKNSFDKFSRQSNVTPYKTPAKHTSIQELHEIQYKTVRQLADEAEVERAAQGAINHTWSNATSNSTLSSRPGSFQYHKLTMSPGFIGHEMFAPHAISARMTELIEGSTEEPKDLNLYSRGCF